MADEQRTDGQKSLDGDRKSDLYLLPGTATAEQIAEVFEHLTGKKVTREQLERARVKLATVRARRPGT